MTLSNRLCFKALLFALAASCASVAQAERIEVVASEALPAFREASQSLVDELGRLGVARSDVRVMALSDVTPHETASDEVKLVITLGAKALSQVMGVAGHPPVVAALIPRQGFERIVANGGKKGSTGVTAVYLDQPFSRQLGLLRLVAPNARVLGVVWGPESLAQRSQLLAVLRGTGLQLREAEIAGADSLVSGLKSTISDADVFLAVPDPQVFNAATISDILMMTYRARVPVLAFSPAYTKAGAMASLFTSPQQIGVQAATMAAAYLQSGSLPAADYPNDYAVSVNEYVARSMGFSLEAQRLRAQLAGQEKKP